MPHSLTVSRVSLHAVCALALLRTAGAMLEAARSNRPFIQGQI